MTGQLSLDQALSERHAYVARAARQTSRDAGARAFPRSATNRFRVLESIATGGPVGRTDDEVIVRTGLAHQSVGPRRLELLEGGWIEDSGRKRATRTGAQAIVWVLSQDGQARWAGNS